MICLIDKLPVILHVDIPNYHSIPKTKWEGPSYYDKNHTYCFKVY